MSNQSQLGTYDQRRAAIFRRNAALMPERNTPEYAQWMREAAWRIEDFDRDYLLRKV